MTAPAAAEPAPAAPNRLPLILGVGVAAILALLILSRLGGGGGDGAAPAPSVTVPPSSVPATTTPAPPPPAETFEVFTSKNPFKPLRSTASATASSGSSTTRSGSTSAAAGSGSTAGSSATGNGTSASSTGTSTGTGSGGTEPGRGERVSLLDVFTDKGRTVANVKVNDTVHKVAVGEVFATSFKVVSLSQSDGCGRFLFGDDQFRLCEGEEVLK